MNTESRVLHITRLKGGLSTTQPLRGDELKAISAWLRQRARMKPAGKSFFNGPPGLVSELIAGPPISWQRYLVSI